MADQYEDEEGISINNAVNDEGDEINDEEAAGDIGDDNRNHVPPPPPPPPAPLVGPPPPPPFAAPGAPPQPDWSQYKYLQVKHPPVAGSLLERLQQVQLQSVADDENNNNTPAPPEPLDHRSELANRLREKATKSTANRQDQIHAYKERLLQKRYDSFEDAKKFLQEVLELQTNMARTTEDEYRWPSNLVEALQAAVTLLNSALTALEGIDKSLKGQSQLDNFAQLEGFWGLLAQSKRDITAMADSINNCGIPMPFGLTDRIIRLMLDILLKMFSTGFRKAERIDKTLSKFDTQYTVKSAYTYLHTSRSLTLQTKALANENPSEEETALFAKVEKKRGGG